MQSSQYHNEVCVREEELNAEYPGTTCLGWATGDTVLDGQPVLAENHYVLDLISGTVINTDEQVQGDAAEPV